MIKQRVAAWGGRFLTTPRVRTQPADPSFSRYHSFPTAPSLPTSPSFPFPFPFHLYLQNPAISRPTGGTAAAYGSGGGCHGGAVADADAGVEAQHAAAADGSGVGQGRAHHGGL